MELDNFPHGTVQFFPAVEAEEEKRHATVQNGVTINNITSAVEGRPAHFGVSFMLTCSHEVEGIQTRNIFHFSTVAVGGNDMTYKEVENAAAEQLPGLLRELADALQADIDRANQS